MKLRWNYLMRSLVESDYQIKGTHLSIVSNDLFDRLRCKLTVARLIADIYLIIKIQELKGHRASTTKRMFDKVNSNESNQSSRAKRRGKSTSLLSSNLWIPRKPVPRVGDRYLRIPLAMVKTWFTSTPFPSACQILLSQWEHETSDTRCPPTVSDISTVVPRRQFSQSISSPLLWQLREL